MKHLSVRSWRTERGKPTLRFCTLDVEYSTVISSTKVRSGGRSKGCLLAPVEAVCLIPSPVQLANMYNTFELVHKL